MTNDNEGALKLPGKTLYGLISERGIAVPSISDDESRAKQDCVWWNEKSAVSKYEMHKIVVCKEADLLAWAEKLARDAIDFYCGNEPLEYWPSWQETDFKKWWQSRVEGKKI